MIIREKRISRFIYHRIREGGEEGKGNIRACVCEIHAEDIPSDEKWGGKSRVNPLIMSEIRGTRFAENDSDVREICIRLNPGVWNEHKRS